MTLALAQSLIDCSCIDGQHCSSTYASFFKNPPLRGYGPAVTKILQALLHGASYKMTATMVYPEGSYANGGVMRIAPVGLAFRNADADTLRRAVESALVCTHVHPEAIDGAFLQVFPAKNVVLM
jgi:poly(ADP-ribose) glycohydrolase ARH3